MKPPVSRSHRTLERALRVLFALVCLALALSPLTRSGFTGDDLALLGRASGHAVGEDDGTGRGGAVDRSLDERPAAPRPLFDVPPIDVMQLVGDDAMGDTGSLLSGYSIGLSLRLWGTGAGDEPGALPVAFWYRFENFVWLVVAALGLWRFLWRIFRPWVGSDQATRASSAAAFLFVLHPLAVPSVAAVAGRADLMALAFGTWAAAAFLRGRQERHYTFVYTAAALTLLAGLCGQIALIIPFSMALAEVFSSYRYRPLAARLRTALVTFLIFTAVVQLNAAVVSLISGHGYYPVALVTLSRLGDLDGALRAAALSIEKIGVLLLPANMATLGLVGLFFAGLVGLVALQPALIAARTAPRLWGWTLFCWLCAVAVSLLFGVHERVRLDGLATATTLLPAAAALCGGFGLAATALPGLRRIGVPIALALGLSILANGNARAFERATDTFADTVAQLRAGGGDEGVTLLLDAPRRVAGMDPIGRGLDWARHPLFDPTGPWPSAPRTLDVPLDAVGLVVRSQLWADWRTAGLRVGTVDAEGAWTIEALGPPPLGDDALDPAARRALRITSQEALGEGALLHFLGSRREGVRAIERWDGPPGARTALLDLADGTDWLLAGAVERLWLEPQAPDARLEPLEDLPAFTGSIGAPAALDDGRFALGTLDASEREGSFEFRLLDLDTLETLALELEPDASGLLTVAPPKDLIYRAREYPDHDFAFELTRRVDGHAVARIHGDLPRSFLD